MQDYTSLSHSTLCKRLAAAERKLCGLKYVLRASKRGLAPRWKPKIKPWLVPVGRTVLRAPGPTRALAVEPEAWVPVAWNTGQGTTYTITNGLVTPDELGF